MTDNLDSIRANTLNKIEQNERNYKLAFLGAAVAELFFLGGFLLLMDFKDRGQVLLLIATVATYTIVAISLFALGLHNNRNTLRILQAIQLSQEEREK